MQIRKATIKDLEQIRTLFYDTIKTVNVKDYNSDQIEVWASGHDNIDHWVKKLQEQHFMVAASDDMITGFGSITKEGYIDLLYVHKKLQGQGIAKSLLQEMELYASKLNLKELNSEVSITAVPFFERQGFIMIRENRKIVKGIGLINFLMAKKI